MKNVQRILLIGSAVLILFSCNRASDTSKVALSEPDAAAEPMALSLEDQSEPDAAVDAAANERLIVPQKKIIKTGSVSVESRDVAKSKKDLDALVSKHKGFYEEETLSKGNSIASYNLNIRIPVQSYEAFIAELESGKDNITSKSIQSQDMTGQYYDLDSRLKSKKAYLQRYTELLSKARNVKEILEIEEQIRVIQEEIDATAASLKSLNEQVAYSTLSVYLYQEQSNISIGADSFGTKLVDAVRFGWTALETFFIILIRIWPFLLIGVLGFVVIRKYKKRRKQ
ncbi:DUF4349 domain-containing protein [Sphingobacterium spiritivorum]|uniref:DUF4349 domain-containing protein n=1 Tax=Sphingobacterium spiritivorum ATCC 33861 TaxID=525373 RepID=D7VIM7_SPHSI|nr:DUF4349 domain-containing protein [Sphingobacterium spiritivorum]EFK59929.1 hypothetical protein HMPREF0766_10846 [Sphingobacterium spiritivorum ATCC 33861]QQT37436.1 DUF4349 domain-containing protein [Sphingobacterium spiritivorum]WQD34230.1 DUF4349 domain-containing protein [Sphingobacterium spiritivorum]SUI97053.1 Uncharacterised protein [Sphingobacterium spiritivorum]